MPEPWVYLTPEICKHDIDTRHKWRTEIGSDGSVTTIVTRSWCRKCLAEVDIKSVLEYVRTHDIEVGR